MRKLNFSEQTLVSKLVANSADATANFPIKALESVFQDNKVTFHNDEVAYFNFYVSEGKEESVSEKSKGFINKILEAVSLLDYLKKEGLILELESNKDSTLIYGDDVSYVSAGLVESRVYIETDLIAQQLVRFVNNSIYVTDSLKELLTNEFKGIEDDMLAQAKVQTKKTGRAIILAFLAVIISVAGVVVSSLNSSEKGSEDKSAAVVQPLEKIQGVLENNMLPAIVDLKTEIAGVRTAVSELDAEPVSLSDLKKDEQEEPKKDEPKKKAKKHKRK
ncbi:MULTISPECIES: hypothetical protein [unclassified Fibrobacter]|uniref:hypothetical protein n=1 Tax=unclassified Fibrobacter TaxID=2634177 RepID=UPI000D6CEFE3|nr:MULTISPECIES: hypothetical protein [unclassified Fibrobacter]PWJ61509.1 hypothetical protein BGX12_12740 [Fibrobacter sp. UWR4]PZW67325.1 hypothetical protein C8E88_102740 [Fibrobacter sp. UWR1]